MTSIWCCYSQHEIFDRNNSKSQGTAHPTRALSHNVLRTALQQEEVKDTEIKDNLLVFDKTYGATALKLCEVNPTGAAPTAALCSRWQGVLFHPPIQTTIFVYGQ